MKIHYKGELQQIAINLSADIEYQNFMKIYKNVKMNHILF